MYPYPMPPPWGGYPQTPPPNDEQFQRGMRLAMKIAQREEREKERKKFNERKHRDEDRKAAEAARKRVWLAIELYILGIISQPFIVPAYNHLLAAVAK